MPVLMYVRCQSYRYYCSFAVKVDELYIAEMSVGCWLTVARPDESNIVELLVAKDIVAYS